MNHKYNAFENKGQGLHKNAVLYVVTFEDLLYSLTVVGLGELE